MPLLPVGGFCYGSHAKNSVPDKLGTTVRNGLTHFVRMFRAVGSEVYLMDCIQERFG
jgi:hypothetical protein